MKTSSKISLKFTLFTVVIVFFFGFGANMIFLHNWYGPAEAMLHAPGPRNQQMNKVLGRERGPQVEQFALISEEAKVVLESQWLRDIAKIGDRYFLFWQGPENVFITDVTHTIEAQENLLWIALYLLFIFAGLAYVVSLFFVKSALRSLHNLVDFAQHLDLDRLDQQIEIEGPDDDEIKILANTLNHSLQKLHVQAFSLKDFVAHASHELKTPLMAMSAEIDLAIKAKDFSSLHQVKIYLRSMNDLIEQLLLITKLESGGELTMKKEKIQHVVANMVEMVKKKYADKHLDRVVDIHEVLSKCHLSSFEMIVQNLLDNAAKYSQSGGKITVILDQKTLVVQDDGAGIEKKYLGHIWDRFWQEDSSRTDKKSFGLGLYLVKKLVDLHGWDISVESEKGKGTEFQLLMHHK